MDQGDKVLLQAKKIPTLLLNFKLEKKTMQNQKQKNKKKPEKQEQINKDNKPEEYGYKSGGQLPRQGLADKVLSAHFYSFYTSQSHKSPLPWPLKQL